MTVSVKDLRAKFPEFKQCDTGIGTLAIEEAECNINATAWGSRADLGTLYLAAHLLKIASKGDSLPGGPLSSYKAGDITAQWATPRLDGAGAITAGTLLRTVYGMRYMELRRLIFASRVL